MLLVRGTGSRKSRLRMVKDHRGIVPPAAASTVEAAKSVRLECQLQTSHNVYSRYDDRIKDTQTRRPWLKKRNKISRAKCTKAVVWRQGSPQHHMWRMLSSPCISYSAGSATNLRSSIFHWHGALMKLFVWPRVLERARAWPYERGVFLLAMPLCFPYFFCWVAALRCHEHVNFWCRFSFTDWIVAVLEAIGSN